MTRRRNYKYGRNKEKKVAKILKSKGFNTNLSPGSRGPSDIKAINGSRKWCVQVKSSRNVGDPHIIKEELRRLKIQATLSKGVPVIAEVNRGRVKFISARTGRRLKP